MSNYAFSYFFLATKLPFGWQPIPKTAFVACGREKNRISFRSILSLVLVLSVIACKVKQINAVSWKCVVLVMWKNALWCWIIPFSSNATIVCLQESRTLLLRNPAPSSPYTIVISAAAIQRFQRFLPSPSQKPSSPPLPTVGDKDNGYL